MREKWIDNYEKQRDLALWALPFPVRYVVGWMISSQISKTLYGQGTGRFTVEEVETFKYDAWQALNDILSPSAKSSTDGEPFWILGNNKPTQADMVLFGFVTSVLLSER